MLDEVYRAAGLVREVAVEVRSGQAAGWFVQQGCGVALLDEFTVSTGSFGGVAVRRFEPQVRFEVTLLHNRFRPLSRQAAQLGEILREVLSQMQPPET
jgi:DNA-binding transcriptional LysR family regulator